MVFLVQMTDSSDILVQITHNYDTLSSNNWQIFLSQLTDSYNIFA
jgi:hypothetical protein